LLTFPSIRLMQLLRRDRVDFLRLLLWLQRQLNTTHILPVVVRRSFATSGSMRVLVPSHKWVASTDMRCPWTATLNNRSVSTMACRTGTVVRIMSMSSHRYLPLLRCQALLSHLPTVWMAHGVAWSLHRPRKATFRRVIACKLLLIILVSSSAMTSFITLLTIYLATMRGGYGPIAPPHGPHSTLSNNPFSSLKIEEQDEEEDGEEITWRGRGSQGPHGPSENPHQQ
jgi:hypothetical protein